MRALSHQDAASANEREQLTKPGAPSANEPTMARVPNREGTRRARWIALVWMCGVFAGVALSYHTFFLKTFDHWWVDDDPRNFAMVRSVANPLSFFIDPEVARNFSVTTTVNPMLGLSVWLDSKLAYRNIRFAQLHNVLILTATLCLLFLILRRCGLSLAGASVASLVWLFLPATGVVSEWLAARHRMPTPHLGYIASVVALPVAIAGGVVTQKKWDLLSRRYEAEGKYYLKYPDRLVYSEVPAGWYLDGIQQLYDVPVRHHVIAGHEQTQLAQQLAAHSEIWRYADGEFVKDPQLFLQLKAETERTASAPHFRTH